MPPHNFKQFPELSNSQIAEFGLTSPHKQITENFRATVTKVTDGDTIRLRTTFRDFDFPMRFLDIDAPENSTGAPGKRARDWLTQRLLGNEVSIMIDQDNRVDKYGRLLGRVFYAGFDVGMEELRLGLVTTFANRMEGDLPNNDKTFSLKQWLST